DRVLAGRRARLRLRAQGAAGRRPGGAGGREAAGMSSRVLEVKLLDPRFGDSWPLPAYATESSAGMDLRAAIEAPLVLQPGDAARAAARRRGAGPQRPGDPHRRPEPVRAGAAALGPGPPPRHRAGQRHRPDRRRLPGAAADQHLEPGPGSLHHRAGRPHRPAGVGTNRASGTEGSGHVRGQRPGRGRFRPHGRTVKQGAGMKQKDAGPGLSQVRRGALLLAALLALLAGWFAWSGVRQWQADQRLAQLEAARDQVVEATAAAVRAQTRALAGRLESAAVAAALEAGDAEAAAAALVDGWDKAEQAQVLRADLAAAHADAATFGYARLALLQRALAQDEAVATVVRDADRIALGVAAPVRLGQDAAVAYVRLPLGVLTAATEAAAVPDGAYLALRQGNYNVLERGDAGLG